MDAAFNSRGYKVLPSCIRLIKGCGINAQSLPLLRQTTLADVRQRAHAAALHLANAG